MERQQILNYLYKWSEPFNPIVNFSEEKRKQEIDHIVKKLNRDDLGMLVDIYITTVEEDQKFVFSDFLQTFIQYFNISSELLYYLKNNGPWEIIELIGYTKSSDMYSGLIDKIVYSQLSNESKFHLYTTMSLLNNILAIDQLKLYQQCETDLELLKDISIAIDKIRSKH